MALNWAVPEEMVGSRMTAARVTCGAICLSSSSHLPLKPYSKTMKPVMLPRGRDRLSTKPAPTGSGTIANTIGKVRVTWYNAITLMVFSAKTTSRKRDQFLRVSARPVGIVLVPADVDPHVRHVAGRPRGYGGAERLTWFA